LADEKWSVADEEQRPLFWRTAFSVQ